MRLKTMVLAALAVLAATSWQADEAQSREETFYAGELWRGYASYDPDTGGFGFCAVYSEYENGIDVHIALNDRFELIILLGNPAWRLTQDSEFPLRLSIDKRWSTDAVGVATDSTGVGILLGGDLDAYEALRKGRLLTVEAKRQTFPFVLTGTAVALREAARCVFDRTQTAAHGDPFSVEGDPLAAESDPFSKRGGDKQDGDAVSRGPGDGGSSTRNMIVSLLAVAGLQGVRMLDDAEIDQGFPYADQAWQVGEEAYGVFMYFKNDGRTPDEFAADELAALSRACTGRFASGTLPAQPSGTAAMKRYFASCDDGGGDNTYVLHGTMLVGPEAVGIIEHFGNPQRAAAVAALDERVASVLVRYD